MQDKPLKSKKNKNIEELDKSKWHKLDEIEEYKNSIKGKWVQRGPYIINTSSKLDYGIYVGIEQMLVGVDKKGQPILKSRYKD